MLSIMLLVFLVCWPGRLRAQDAVPLPAEPRRTVGPGVAVFDAHDFENPHGARCVIDADHPCAPQKLLRALQVVLGEPHETLLRAETAYEQLARMAAREQALADSRKIVQDCAAIIAQSERAH